MIMLQEWQVRLIVGRRALEVEVDPLQVAGRLRDRRRRSTWKSVNQSKALPRHAKVGLNLLLRETRKFDLADDDRFDLVSFEQGKAHRILTDIWEHRDRIPDSRTYSQIMASIQRDGVFRYKRHVITRPSEIIPLMQSCYCDLLISMAQEGYLPNKRSKLQTGGIGLAIVWRDGTLWHDEGATHRLVAARITGLRSGFPLRIVAAHRDWLAEHGIRNLSDLSRLPLALQSATGVLSSHNYLYEPA